MKNIFLIICKCLVAFSFLCFFGQINSGCSVEVELPPNQLIGEAVFEDKASADAAMRHIFASIRDAGVITGSAGLSVQLGAYADELDFYSISSNLINDFFLNSLLPTNTAIKNYWNSSYYQIYASNALIERVQLSTRLDSLDVSRLTGEAIFCRALLHFYLSNIFGKIPYITTSNYLSNQSVFRMPESEIYNLLIRDLERAIELLPKNYSGSDRARPNKLAAQALLARIYLYNGNWNGAFNAATAVILETSYYTDEVDLNKVFLKASKETIWHLPPPIEGRNTNEAASFVLTAAPPNSVALNENLVNSFSHTDLRKTRWIGNVQASNGKVYYFPHKYKQNNPGPQSTEYSIVFRLAECYLIRAEAATHLDNMLVAYPDLNKIRSRAGLPALGSLTKQQMLDSIQVERRHELFTEFGHRFFDLRRTGQLNLVLSAAKQGWEITDRLFPIPQSELDLNTNLLPQNEGY